MTIESKKESIDLEFNQEDFDAVSKNFISDWTEKTLDDDEFEEREKAIKNAEVRKDRDEQLKQVEITKEAAWTIKWEWWRLLNEANKNVTLDNQYYVWAVNSDLNEIEHITMKLNDIVEDVIDPNTKTAMKWWEYDKKYEEMSRLTLSLNNVTKRMKTNVEHLKDIINEK